MNAHLLIERLEVGENGREKERCTSCRQEPPGSPGLGRPGVKMSGRPADSDCELGSREHREGFASLAQPEY